MNAGAIMTNSMVRPDLGPPERFDFVMKMWHEASGIGEPTFNNSVYLSERNSADRNFALAYFMKENGSFPENTEILETLEFYFRCCSIEQTSESMLFCSHPGKCWLLSPHRKTSFSAKYSKKLPLTDGLLWNVRFFR